MLGIDATCEGADKVFEVYLGDLLTTTQTVWKWIGISLLVLIVGGACFVLQVSFDLFTHVWDTVSEWCSSVWDWTKEIPSKVSDWRRERERRGIEKRVQRDAEKQKQVEAEYAQRGREEAERGRQMYERESEVPEVVLGEVYTMPALNSVSPLPSHLPVVPVHNGQEDQTVTNGVPNSMPPNEV
ncbi:hypothetical protein KIPB_011515 [Kipferlia bialata]|uniref:Uncharacterized protein n=1 Tax=Kipferlia bialata TaxID=797122 RepID=A0A9K3D5R7_9EUKA|nr:hypothetical protein KIPB_011515 [Kipferlia bialata]|eukprot:g11515.t1